MRVFLTGGTGLIGTSLVDKLNKRGDKAVLLTRRAAEARQMFGERAEIVEGDPTKAGPWMDAIGGCDGVINLAGENIFGKRWNDDFKRAMRESRTLSTNNVVEALARNPRRADGQPKTLVNASAVGYYGPHGDEELTETAPAGGDFLSKLCSEWEESAKRAEASGIRVVLTRIGVVLDKRGGGLATMLTPFKLFIGGPAGSGKQVMSWIHHADMVGLLLFALDKQAIRGPMNATAPQPVTNSEFSKALGKTLGRPSFMPVPAFALKLRFGQVSEVVLTGQRVIPRVALDNGYTFQFPTIEAALADAVK